jgi:G:T/U-mismatch repair DNA glycosylase
MGQHSESVSVKVESLMTSTLPAEETHPYNLREAIPSRTKVLLLGTAPPPRFSSPSCGEMRGLDFDFFYGSEDNYMWVFLDDIAERIDGRKLFEEEFSSPQCSDVAREFLKKHHIWMHDVLRTYRRKPGMECSASDSDIVPLSFTSFGAVLDSPFLEKIVFTSRKAAEWTFLALANQGLTAPGALSPPHLSRDQSIPIEKYIRTRFKAPFARATIAGRNIDFYILPSPSPRAVRSGLTLSRKQDIYRSVLFG